MPDEFYPTFSDAERDRRWRETRERLNKAGLAALAMPQAGGHWDHYFADQRYLSQVGGNQYRVAMVFPSQGDPTVIIPGFGEAVHWRKVSWVDDIRGSDGRQFARALVARLKELGLEKERIGVPNLYGVPRVGESPIPHVAVEALREQLPHAEVVDATDLMHDQRQIKSPEEISMLERASAVAEHGIFMLGYSVKAGMQQTEAAGILVGEILKRGGELSGQLLWECNQRPGRTWWHVPHVRIAPNDIIQNELEPKVAGYSAREVHTICVGKPAPEVYEAWELSTKIFENAMELIKPGAPIGATSILAREMAHGTRFKTSITSFGTGLTQEELPEDEDATYRENQVIVFKPVVRTDDGLGINFASTLVVTPEGGKRLSRRPLELMLTSRSLMSYYVDEPRKEPTAPWLR